MQNMDTQPARGAQPGAKPAAGGAAPGLPSQPMTADQVRKMQTMAKQAMSLLLEDAHANQIVQAAKQGDPKQVVSDLVLKVMQQVWQAGAQAGALTETPGDIVAAMVAGLQIIADLTEMLIAAGVLQQSEAQGFVGEVSKIVVTQHNAGVQGGGQQPPAAAPPQQPQPGAPQ